MVESPYIHLIDLYPLLLLPSLNSAKVAVRKGRFPIPHYKINNKIVFDKEAVKFYFALEREKALRILDQ